VLVHRKPELPGTVGCPDPGAFHADPATTKGDLAGLVAVANRAAIRVVAALWADDLGDFFFHQLGQDAEPNAHRERQKALLGDPHQLPERLLDAWGQWAFGVHVGLPGRYVFLHGGPP
jgi:hypothetical protein